MTVNFVSTGAYEKSWRREFSDQRFELLEYSQRFEVEKALEIYEVFIARVYTAGVYIEKFILQSLHCKFSEFG